MHEVYAYGVIAPSTLIELEDGYPPEAGYAEIGGIHASLGGEAAGGAYVLARLGIATKLSGTELGPDPSSRWVIAILTEAGVDCSGVVVNADRHVAEIVVSGRGERTVFGTYGRMLADRAWTPPSRADIRSSRAVCLDPFLGEESEAVARWCVDDRVPYVTVDVPPGSGIARHAEALVVSDEFVRRTFDRTDPRDVLAAYTDECRGLVILTRGSGQILFGRHGGPPRYSQAFAVEARDTTGAGDSFRAGVVYGLLEAYSEDRLVTTASAIAALVCRTSPGVLHSPTQQQLAEFLDGARRDSSE